MPFTQPGLPAVTLAPFRPAIMTAKPNVALGNAVTMIKLKGNGGNVPFTFGQPFVEGDLNPGDSLTARTVDGEFDLQMDVKCTHNDGSIRHAVISGIIPKLEGSRDVWLIRSAPRAAKPWAGGSALNDCITHVQYEGKHYTATPGSTKAFAWLLGDVVQEFIHNVPLIDDAGVPHKALTAQFAVRDYITGQSKIDVTVEHTKAYTCNGMFTPLPTAQTPNPVPYPAMVDVTYDVRHVIAGTDRYKKTGLVHFPATRWRKTYWRNTEPDLHVVHFTPYLIASKAVPSYDQRIKISEAYLAGIDATLLERYEPMQPGRFTPHMGATGGRPEIGLMPDSYAAWLLSGDPRAMKTAINSANAGGSWSTHRRDDGTGPAAGQPLDVIHWPHSTILGVPGDSHNYATGQREKLPPIRSASKLVSDSDHQPAFAYLPYLLTGDFYLMEELQFYNGYNMYEANCAYRGYHKAEMTLGQVRGQAWNLRTMGEAAAFTPDAHPLKAPNIYWLTNTARRIVELHATPGGALHSPLGATLGSGAVIYNGGTGIASWQDYFHGQGLSHAAELTGIPDLITAAKWKSAFAIGTMTDPEFCWIDAAAYSMTLRLTNTSPFATTFGEVYRLTFPAERMASPCNSPERLAYLNAIRAQPSNPLAINEIIGYSYSTTGYPSNMQPGLAYAIDFTDRADLGKLAWERFDTRATQPKYDSEGAQFAVVPRRFTPAFVLPAAPPPPVVIAPTPTPPPVVIVPPPVVITPTPTPLLGSSIVVSGTMTIKHQTFIGKKGLNVNVYNSVSKVNVLTSSKRTPSTTGLISITSKLLLGGVSYAAWVSDSTGAVLAGVKP